MKRNKCLSVIMLVMVFFRFDITYAETVKYISCGTTKEIPYYLPSLIRTFITIIQFVIPIIIIIMGSTDFLKVVFGNNKDDLSKAMKKFALRLIAGAAVFLLVTAVKELIKIANDENSSNNLSECFSCFVVDDSYCTSYDVEIDKDADKKENLSNTEKQKQFLEKREQQREENEKKAKQAKKRNTTGSSVSKSNITPGTKNIFIGDSRMVGLCNSVNGTAFQTETGIYKNGNNYFIAKGAMSFYWLKNTAVPLANQVLESNPGVRFNIVIDMGTNDAYFKVGGNGKLVFNVSGNYLPLYQKLSNDWSGHKVIISSLNPILGNYYLNGYVFNNDSVNQFNEILKTGIANLPNFTFCDVNSQIMYIKLEIKFIIILIHIEQYSN